MADQQARGERGPTVVTLPARIDIGNARQVADELLAAAATGATTVIADLTSTTRCSAAGVHQLALACQRAAARNVDLRLVVPPGDALRVFILTGHVRWLPIYPSMSAALAGPSPGRSDPGKIGRAHV